VGTLGLARGTVVAARAEAATVSAAVTVRLVPTPNAALASVSEDSGDAGREVCVLKGGRSKDVSEGDGGSGVGGRL